MEATRQGSSGPTRRRFLSGSSALLGLAMTGGTARAVLAKGPLEPGWLRDVARDLSRRPFRDRPSLAGDLTYDQYRWIRQTSESALWYGDGLPFMADFFHVGGLYKKPVELAHIFGGEALPIAYDPTLFDFGPEAKSLRKIASSGFAGLRLHHPMDGASFSEFAVFLGASYFRAIGAGQSYGLSARGLAIRSGLAGEEFPDFVAFWLERPAPGADRVVLHALLDGESVTGAYRFAIRPGATTVMDVAATLFPRRRLPDLGIAPLTSMFMRGEADRGDFFDYRPKVHDSEALSVALAGDEWTFRPLRNPAAILASRFQADRLRGFGLVQRDRDFRSYLDLEARYDLRPGLWVQPLNDWGRGEVRLVELPTPDETQDNVVAFWTPEAVPEAGDELDFAYRLHWGPQPPFSPPLATVVGTHSGDAGLGNTPDASARKFVVDFRRAPSSPDIDAPLELVAKAEGARILHAHVEPNGPLDGWRVNIDVAAAGGVSPEVSCLLTLDGEPVSERWAMH